MRFEPGAGPLEHIPDFLAVTAEGTWLLDVRPADRVEAADRVKFAASAEAALACGWRYGMVGGWQPHVMTTLDTLSAQRRPLSDPLGLADCPGRTEALANLLPVRIAFRTPRRQQQELTDRAFRVKIGQLVCRLIDHRLTKGRKQFPRTPHPASSRSAATSSANNDSCRLVAFVQGRKE
jgi:hypothetical protein